MELGIPVAQPLTLKHNEQLQAELHGFALDAIVVVAYGRILPQWMLSLPRLGCVNAHGSLLPRWRGAAPIQWAIASGDTETGVTTMQMDAGLDTGAILLQTQHNPIEATTTAPDMFGTLADISASLTVQTLHGLAEGSLNAVPQQNAAATLAPLLTRDDARIDWSRTAFEIDRRFRGFQPWPGAWTMLRGKKLIVHAMRQTTSPANPADCGTLTAPDGHLVVACGQSSSVQLDEVQLEGKKRVSAAEFLRGFQLKTGERLDRQTS